MATLTLNATSLTVSTERVSYNSIRLKFQRLAEAAAEHFATNFTATFKNMDDIHNKCTEQFIPMLRETAEIAVQDIVAHGIYDIDLELFGEYMGSHVTWDEDFAVIDDKYMGIVLKAEELDAYRTQRRESRGRWVGGGFGFSGAVKGAMQAGAMNIATGAVHGLFNLTAKGINAVGDAIKKNELYTAPGTKAALVGAVYRSILSVHFALIDAINDKQPGTITGAVSAEDDAKASICRPQQQQRWLHGRDPSRRRLAGCGKGTRVPAHAFSRYRGLEEGFLVVAREQDRDCHAIFRQRTSASSE